MARDGYLILDSDLYNIETPAAALTKKVNRVPAVLD